MAVGGQIIEKLPTTKIAQRNFNEPQLWKALEKPNHWCKPRQDPKHPDLVTSSHLPNTDTTAEVTPGMPYTIAIQTSSTTDENTGHARKLAPAPLSPSTIAWHCWHPQICVPSTPRRRTHLSKSAPGGPSDLLNICREVTALEQQCEPTTNCLRENGSSVMAQATPAHDWSVKSH